MNEKRNEELANDIRDFLLKNSLSVDTRIYFNGKCYDWCDGDYYYKEPKIMENIKATDYFEYAKNKSVSMSFEGALYDIMNYGEYPDTREEFDAIFDKHNCYYELGHAWNLSVSFD